MIVEDCQKEERQVSDNVKKHVRNHLLEYLIDMVMMVLFTLIVLYFCKAEELWLGIILER